MARPQSLPHHWLPISAAALSLLALASIWTLDGRVAVWADGISPGARAGVGRFVDGVEFGFAFGITPYLYGFLIILIAAAIRVRRADSRWPPALLLIGLTHLVSRFAADFMKPPFSRLRPFEALNDAGWRDVWFADVGNSFPSGHAVHFWGIFFPLLIVAPRLAWPFAVLAIAISVARVWANDHYVSDVLASAALAAAVAWLASLILRTRDRT